MIEMRQDPTTRGWVLVGQTGDDMHSRLALAPERCPFCPGREGDTAPAVMELRGAGGGWRVRAFADRLPVFQIEGQLDPQGEGIYDRMRNVGAHEVIVETPLHDTTLAACADADVAEVLRVFRARIRELKRDTRLRYVQVYKNQGRQAGAHIPHAHSHVLATPILPRRMEAELRWSKHYYERKERCLFCDMLRQEREAGARLVEQTADAVAFCPFAPRAPFETWLVPTAHSHRFEDADDALLDRLAPVLRRTLRRIEQMAPSYHLTLHNGPNEQSPAVWGRPWESLPNDFHWHIEVLPRPDGAERLPREEEFVLTLVLPEDAARRLRQAPVS